MKRSVLFSAITLCLIVPIFHLINPSRSPSLCKMASNPNRHDNEYVRIKAALYGSAAGTLHLNGIECGPSSDAWATLEFDASFSPDSKAQEFLQNIRDVHSEGEYNKGEVIVSGEVEDLVQPCFAPRFVVYARDLKPVSEISAGTFQNGVE